MAVEAQLEGPELQAFVEQQKKAFDELQVLNVKKNLAQCTLITAELNAFLSVFDQWAAADKAELARSLLNHSAHTGNLTQQQLEVFALKLARMGIHQ